MTSQSKLAQGNAGIGVETLWARHGWHGSGIEFSSQLSRHLKQQGAYRLHEQAFLIVTQAREIYAEFLKTQQITDDLIRSTLQLGKVDVIYCSLSPPGILLHVINNFLHFGKILTDRLKTVFN